MNPTVLLQHLAELLAKSVLLLVPMLILAALLRRRSAALRHTALLAAFVSLLLLPLGKLAAPHWRWSKPVASAPQTLRVFSTATVNAIATPAIPTLAAVPAKSTWPEPARLLIGMWLVGVALLLGFRAFGSWQIALLKRQRTTPTDPRLSALAEIVARELSCATRHEVRFSDATRIPCTWGLWRAVILLPAEAAHWSEAHLLAALRHEFAHVARRDYLTRWLGSAVCALYWPNPLVWLAARRLRTLQEQACDDLVLRAGTPSADYATLLFETARACTGAPFGWRHAIAMARPSTLHDRVAAIVDEARDRRPVGRFAKLLGGLSVAGLVGASALAQVAETPTPAPAGVGQPAGAVPPTVLGFGIPGFDFGVAQPAGAVPAANATQPWTPRVEVRAKFIEVPKGEFEEWQIRDEVLALEKVANVLSAPRLTIGSGQRGTVQIGEARELPPGSEPKKQFVGTSLEVVPEILADATGTKIHLQCTAEIVSPSGEDPATKLPVFNHRKVTSDLNLGSGRRAVLPVIPSEKPGKEIFVVLEADIVANPNAPESAALAKAKKIVLPTFELRNNTVTEAIDILRKLAIEADPEKQGVKMIVKPGSNDRRLTVSLRDIPLALAFKYVTSLANLELTAEPDAVVIQPPPAPELVSKLTTEVTTPTAVWKLPVEIKAADTHIEGNVAVASGGAQLKYGSTTISAESVRYNPDHHRAEFRGKVEIKTEDSTLQGENLSVEFEPDGRVSVGATTISAKQGSFNNKTKQAEFSGSVEIKTEASTLKSENANVNLEGDGRVYVGKPAGKDAAPIPPAPGGR